MPLKEGSSREIIGKNIATEMHHGKPQNQAIAIAMRKAGKSRSGDQSDPPVHQSRPKTGDVNEPDLAPASRSRMPATMGGGSGAKPKISDAYAAETKRPSIPAEPPYQQAVTPAGSGPGYTVVGSEPYRPVERPGGVSLADMNRINRDRYGPKRR